MTRVDLFTAPECPASPAAREAVASFARECANVIVREWDLTCDPGPAVGRGIVAPLSMAKTAADVLIETLQD